MHCLTSMAQGEEVSESVLQLLGHRVVGGGGTGRWGRLQYLALMFVLT